MAATSFPVLLIVGLVLFLGAAARQQDHEVDVKDAPADHNLNQEAGCVADVPGESVTIARCRATCLHKFAVPPPAGEADRARCTMDTDCMMCWDHCGRMKRGPESLASDCKDQYLCWAGCRAACDFHFPHSASGTESPGAGAMRPTSEAAPVAPPRALPPPRFDADGQAVRWGRVDATSPTASSGSPSSRDTATESGEMASNVTECIVYVVSARMSPSAEWKELKQTTDNWMEMSSSTRAAIRALSVLAVTADGPTARASTCVQPLDSALGDHDYYDDDSDEDDEKEDDSGDSSLQRLAQRSFAQLRGTEQHSALLRALMRNRSAANRIVEEATKDEEANSDDTEEEDADEEEDVQLDPGRLELVQKLLGVATPSQGAIARRGRGWGLRLVGVWAAGGARLPRARVAWTAPRGVNEALVHWAVPALRISGSRVVSGVSQAEVPLVEQHATRVTVGNAHSNDVSPALVLQLSVQTDASAAANFLSAASPLSVAGVPERVQASTPTRMAPSYEQAALWEATLVAVGLVVGAAALCVALLLVAYGVHSRVARCCRGHGRGHGMHSGIHAKSASVEPLNAPDHNNV